MKKYKLAIIGASGLVGQTLLKVLKEESLDKKFELYLITSDKSAGEFVEYNGKIYKYIALNKKCLDYKFDFVIFSAGDEISKIWAYDFIKNGAYVIDNSNSFRREKEIPLVVPEINGDLINKNTKLISNPNCSTIQLALVLYRLKALADIKDVIVSSYQSVSGAGKDALDDLKNGTNKIFKKGIKNNIIVHIGEIEKNGFCKEENKIMFETNKILNDNLNVLATTVRVPTEICHGESVYVKFLQKVDIFSVKNALKCNFIEFSEKFYQIDDCKNTNMTYVCRLRQPSESELMFFIFADNLRRGAAYNAILILKKLLEIL